MMLNVSRDTQAKTKALGVPIWTIYSRNSELKRRCFEIPTCTCVEYDVKWTITAILLKTAVNYSSFVRLQFVITICLCTSARDIAWTKHFDLLLARRSSWKVPFEGENQCLCRLFWGLKIWLVSIAIFWLGGTTPPSHPPSLAAKISLARPL